MSSSASGSVACRVVGSPKLPAETGGAAEVCRMIEAVARDKAPGVAFSVELRVPSASAAAASVRMSNGRVLPDLHIAVSDAALDRSAIERFAAAIAAQVAQAAMQ